MQRLAVTVRQLQVNSDLLSLAVYAEWLGMICLVGIVLIGALLGCDSFLVGLLEKRQLQSQPAGGQVDLFGNETWQPELAVNEFASGEKIRQRGGTSEEKQTDSRSSCNYVKQNEPLFICPNQFATHIDQKDFRFYQRWVFRSKPTIKEKINEMWWFQTCFIFYGDKDPMRRLCIFFRG